MEFIEKFRKALQIPTWWPASARDGDAGAVEPLLRFQELLVACFPAFHRAAERWSLNPFLVVYRLPGAESGDNDAVLFAAHYDVVPAETAKWSTDPFGAEVKDGYIYGRGSLDMKSTLVSVMEAAENLCESGRRPRHDIWFAFGGDEERTGMLGAGEAAAWFSRRGQRFAWVLDEGTPIGENHIKGVDTPVALVSIEEKGYLSLTLTVEQPPGHASRPPAVQAAALLARALCRIANRPFPFRLSPVVEMFFRQLGLLMPNAQGFVMRHSGLLCRMLGPLFFQALSSNPALVSLLRTTAAMTQLKGSAADNVLPSEVSAVINLRLLPPWTVETAIDFIVNVINDKRVNVSVYGAAANPVAARSEYQNDGWRKIQSALEQSRPGIPMLPFLMTATTDSRHYRELSGGIYRFSPHQLSPEELGGIHGHDERISKENLYKGLAFYTALMRLL